MNTVISRRKAKLERRDDFIQYMVDHEDNTTTESEEPQNTTDEEKKASAWTNKPLRKTLTNQEILSQGIFFLTAAHDTAANTLEFVAYSLATNPDVQETLIREVDRVLENHVNY